MTARTLYHTSVTGSAHCTKNNNIAKRKSYLILMQTEEYPGQSPRIPVFEGTSALPKSFETCGQKQYVPDCYLWQFR